MRDVPFSAMYWYVKNFLLELAACATSHGIRCIVELVRDAFPAKLQEPKSSYDFRTNALAAISGAMP